MDLLDGPLKPPPPPGAPKPKADLEAVYRPFEDAALNAQIKVECQEPELPQQQRVNEVLELLANPTTGPATSEEALLTAEVKPPVDLLDLTPTAAANDTASVDLLGEQAPVASPPPAPASSGLDDFDALLTTQPLISNNARPETQAPKSVAPIESTDLLGDTSATSSAAPEVVPESLSQPKADGLDEFEALLAKQPLIKSHQDSEDQMEKIMETAKAQASERYVPPTLDLSTPARGEEWRDPRPDDNATKEGAHKIVERISEVMSNVIPAKACGAAVDEGNDGKVKTQGFGSDDLFGPEKKNRSLTEEASEAWSKFVSVLPDQVRQHIEAPETASSLRQNEAPPSTNVASSSSSSSAAFPTASRSDPVSLAPPAASSSSSRAPAENAMGGRLAPMKDDSALAAEHKKAAIDRSLEGKWVPTYMRHQLAQGGHTTMPQTVNAHEYPADQAPPSMGSAFREMGQEVQENAQAMFAYMVAILSSLAIQCQMCSQNAASTMHETTFADSPDEAQCGPWVEEADLALGPIRSRVQRTIQGVSLENLLDAARSAQVLPSTAGEEQRASNLSIPIQQLVKARAIKRLDSDSFVLTVQVNDETLQQSMAPDAVRLLGCEGPFGSQLFFQEYWRIDSREAKACIDFSNLHAESSQVVLTIRTDIIERRDAGNVFCEVDSRLYTSPRTYGQHLPPGLVEKLTQMHNTSAQLLHGAVIGLAQESKTTAERLNLDNATSNTTQVRSADTSTASWTASQKRPCSSSGKTGLAEKVQAQPGAEIRLDKNLLLQVADGI
jgi:hypothetical protein